MGVIYVLLSGACRSVRFAVAGSGGLESSSGTWEDLVVCVRFASQDVFECAWNNTQEPALPVLFQSMLPQGWLFDSRTRLSFVDYIGRIDAGRMGYAVYE